MITDKELLQSALDALDEIRMVETRDYWDLMNALRARLAEHEDEPVAWMDDAGYCVPASKTHPNERYPKFPIPLYRHPPRPTGLDQLLERIRFLEQQIAEKNQ